MNQVYEMRRGQTTLDEVRRALKQRFQHIYMMWNSGNFYELVASNSQMTVDSFLANLGKPFVPGELACDMPMVRPL